MAGPIYQAKIELDDERLESNGLTREAIAEAVPSMPPVSGWWWLLPPVAYMLRRRRAHRQREALMDALTRGQLEKLMHFSEMATAWMFVAGGAFLIATKETWELAEEQEWPTWVFWALTMVMVAICAAFTVVRSHRRYAILSRAHT